MRFYIDDPIPYANGDETDDLDAAYAELRTYAAIAGGEITRIPGRRNGAGTPYDYILTVPDEPAAVEFYRRFLFGNPGGNPNFSAADFVDYEITPIVD